MNNLVILYNPYYQNDVIEQHVQVLINKEHVAFGKIRSKIKAVEHEFTDELNAIYKNTNSESYLQLFLTEYSSLFVAKVTQISTNDMSDIAPAYYADKELEVEQWYIIEDIRELVRNDFELVRDNYLSNFTTPNFRNHTYAIYGNSYVYPLIVNMKQEIDYFKNEDKDFKHYPDIYKSKEFLNIKNNLITYSFGSKYVNFMHPDTMNNIISAEIEYQANRTNPIYDFSSVIIKYSKTVEQEIYIFIKHLFKYLSTFDKTILAINYNVQGHKYELRDIFVNKPNLGTYKFLLKNNLIQECLDLYCQKQIKFYIVKSIPYYINLVQDIRNETVHGSQPSSDDVQKLREKIIGVSCESIILEIVKTRIKEFNPQGEQNV